MLYPADQVTHSAFVHRVEALMRNAGLSVPALAQLSQIPESTLKNCLYKDTEAKRTLLIRLAQSLKTTVEYLATGSEVGGEAESNSVSVPVYSMEGLAVSLGLIQGNPNSSASYDPIAVFPLPRGFLTSNGVTADSCKIVVVDSDVMSPDIRAGQRVFVDTTPQPLREGVFFIRIRNSVVLRRVTPITSGFTLTASNANIPGTTLLADDYNNPSTEGFGVVARVFMAINLTTF